MNSYSLTKDEQKLLRDINDSFYMLPTLKRIDKFVNESTNPLETWQEVSNQIYSILVNAKPEVEQILEDRKERRKDKRYSAINEVNCW